MPTVRYRNPAGVEHQVQVAVGHSLMEGAVQHGVQGMVAECGGNLACATCHVYIDDEWAARVGAAPPGSREDEMLDHVRTDRLPTSRLSCQVLLTEAMDGVVVRIAASQT